MYKGVFQCSYTLIVTIGLKSCCCNMNKLNATGDTRIPDLITKTAASVRLHNIHSYLPAYTVFNLIFICCKSTYSSSSVAQFPP